MEAVTRARTEHSSRVWPGRSRQTVYSPPEAMSICSEKEKLQLEPGQEGKHTCPLLYAISLSSRQIESQALQTLGMPRADTNTP